MSPIQPTNNNFNLPEIPEIAMRFASHLSLKALLNFRATSQFNQDIAETILIQRLNRKDITFKQIGIKTVSDIILYFGESSCFAIQILDLTDFIDVSDQDILNIGSFFFELTTLKLKDAKITDAYLSKLPTTLTTLFLIGCQELKRVNGLEHLTNLTTLSLKKCEKVMDLTPISKLSLKSLNLQRCFLQFLPAFPTLINLNLGGCHRIKNFEILQNCPSIEFLDLTRCNINNVKLLETLKKLKSLSIALCKEIHEFEFLSTYSELMYLKIGFWRLRKLDFLNQCQSLKTLNLFSCNFHEDDLQPYRDLGIEISINCKR